jgi:hypothetical protein
MLSDFINAHINGFAKVVSYLEINPKDLSNYNKITSANKRVLFSNPMPQIKVAPDVFICEIEKFFEFCDMGNFRLKFDIIVTESHIDLARQYLNKGGVIMDFNGNIIRDELDY